MVKSQENGSPNNNTTARVFIDVGLKVVLFVTFGIMAFSSRTLLSLDKGYGIMVGEVKAGFAGLREDLARIEKKQDDNTKLLNEHEVKLASISANRFTDEDARELLASFSHNANQLEGKIQDLWKAIAEMKAKIPEEIPPNWFVAEVRRLEADMKAMQKETDRLREKLADRVQE
jgi:hypothetical protein